MALTLELHKEMWFYDGGSIDFFSKHPDLTYARILNNDGSVIEITSLDVVKIGRNPDSHIILNDGNVSREHAELRRMNGNWIIINLARPHKHPAYIIRKKGFLIFREDATIIIAEPTQIKNNDILVFGPNTSLKVISV